MIKLTIVLLIGLAVVAALRRSSAALRHWVLTVSIVCAAMMPGLQRVVPRWELPFRITTPWTSDPIALVVPLRVHDAQADAFPGATTKTPTRRDQANRIASVAWMTGTAVAFAALAIGWARLSRLSSRSAPVLGGPWKQQSDALRAELGLRDVALLQSDHPTLLATWGWLRPRVLLPAGAPDWPVERIRVALAHELAHVARRDWIAQLGASVFQAIYWFNPVVWIACRALRRQSELACDDQVLRLGVTAPAYAGHLLEIARNLRASRVDLTFPAPAMARQSSLERRVRAMLSTHCSRLPLSNMLAVCAALAVMTFAMPLAGLMAASQGSSSHFSGTAMDAVGRAMPHLKLVLTGKEDRSSHETTSDASGGFEFRDLAPGEYLIRISQPGFAAVQGRVVLEGGQDLEQDIALQVGTVEETITVRTSADAPPPPPAAPPAPAVPNGRSAPPPPPPAPPSMGHARAPRESRCADSPVGGCLEPPVKLLHVRPHYPSRQRDAGVSAQVRLEGRIGSDGFMKDLRLAAPADGDFASAAIDAASAWRFAPTRVGSVPVETPIRITFNFEAH